MWDVDSPSLDVSEPPLRVKNCPQTTSVTSPFSTPSTDIRWTGPRQFRAMNGCLPVAD
jgi:hypothetical protein